MIFTDRDNVHRDINQSYTRWREAREQGDERWVELWLEAARLLRRMMIAQDFDPGIPRYLDDTRDVALLEADGWEGPDASLAESLFHYGIAWRDDGTDFKFIVRRGRLFDWGNFRKGLDPQREWNWADLGAVATTHGHSLEKWLALPLTDQVYDMLGYYGADNTFGTGTGGFEIKTPEDYT